MSLYYNLKQCLHAVNKLRIQYPKLPPGINDQLTTIETTLTLCQCECAEEEQYSIINDEADGDLLHRTYSTVHELLLTSISSPHTLLQLYFSKSPHWEHYFCNITDIINLLHRSLYPREANIARSIGYEVSSDEDYDSDGGDDKSYLSSDYTGSECASASSTTRVIEKFNRKFIPMRKVALNRRWTVSWKRSYYLM